MPAGSKLKAINTRAKSIRRGKPGMSWHAAQRAAAAQIRSGPAKRKTKKRSTTAVARTHHKTRRHTVGSTAVGRTHHRKKKSKGWFGATMVTQNRVVAIAEIAVGMGVGVAVGHAALRPIEHKITQHFTHPYVAKAMPLAEIAVGGLTYIMAPWKFVRNMGLGVLGMGVHGAAKMLPFHMHSPAETINGVGEFLQTRVPINGSVRGALSGLIQQERGYTKTPTVGEYNDINQTPTVGDYSIYNTPTVGEAEDMSIFYSDPFRRQ